MAEQQQRINQAAQQFTAALVQAFRTSTDHAASQQQGAQLTQEFFNRVIENLRTQAEDTRQMTQELAGQQQRAAEAGQTLAQESVQSYMEFANFMFSFWQESTEAALRRAQRPAGGS